MTANINPVTGIRYGIISANALDPEIIDEIQQRGTDVHYEAFCDEIRAEVHDADSVPDDEKDDEIERRITNYGGQFYDDEPVHEFNLQGVKGRTTWLGGALHVWVFESPVTGVYRLCSPCVPNCGDLNSPVDVLRDKVGELCYDVPADWRVEG